MTAVGEYNSHLTSGGQGTVVSLWLLGTLTSSNLHVAFTRTMVPGCSAQLSCSRRHTRSAALLEGAQTRTRLSGRAWYTFIQGQETKGDTSAVSVDLRRECDTHTHWLLRGPGHLSSCPPPTRPRLGHRGRDCRCRALR